MINVYMEDRIFHSIYYTDDDPQWYVGSFVLGEIAFPDRHVEYDGFDCGDPATVTIPINTIAHMTDAEIIVALRSAAEDAKQVNAHHIARYIDRHLQGATDDQLNWLAERLKHGIHSTWTGAALAKIKLHRARHKRSAPTPGYVYLVEGHGCYKIGRSKNLPNRLRTFNLQLPFQTRLIHSIPTVDMVWAEAYLHATFAPHRLNGEWFRLGVMDVEWITEHTVLNPPQ